MFLLLLSSIDHETVYIYYRVQIAVKFVPFVVDLCKVNVFKAGMRFRIRGPESVTVG